MSAIVWLLFLLKSLVGYNLWLWLFLDIFFVHLRKILHCIMYWDKAMAMINVCDIHRILPVKLFDAQGTKRALMQFADHAGYSLLAYRLIGNCNICRRTDKALIRLRECAVWSGPSLLAYGIYTFFPPFYRHLKQWDNFYDFLFASLEWIPLLKLVLSNR